MLSLFIVSQIACNSADQGFSAQATDIYTDNGYASFEVTPQVIIFTEMEDGITYSSGFTVESTGDAMLQIDKVDITNSAEGVFYIDTSTTEDVNLDPGVSREFFVIAQAVTAGVYVGEARIKSNDSSNRDMRIPICAYPLGYEGALTCGDETDTAETVDTGDDTDTATE